MKYLIKKIKELRLYFIKKHLKECKHGFETKDVCNLKIDPVCKNGCGKKLSELADIC